MRRREDLAWCAGFFEGEGAFTLQRNKTRQRATPTIHIGQVDREPLDEFRRRIGIEGRLYTREHRGKDGFNRAPIWDLHYNRRADVETIVGLLQPWLSARRRDQATKMLTEGAWRPRPRPTHCKRGHELTPENSRVDRHGWKACKTCLTAYEKQRWRDKKANR